jgi:hypothetical protein
VTDLVINIYYLPIPVSLMVGLLLYSVPELRKMSAVSLIINKAVVCVCNNELSSSQPICASPFTDILSSEGSAESTGPWPSHYGNNPWEEAK